MIVYSKIITDSDGQKRCNVCCNEIHEGYRFCPECGADLYRDTKFEDGYEYKRYVPVARVIYLMQKYLKENGADGHIVGRAEFDFERDTDDWQIEVKY